MDAKPMMINTTRGLMPESELDRTVTFEDKPREFVVVVEYRIGDEVVHRSAHLILKDAGVTANVIAGSISG
jgi:hypothetical protein